MPASFLSPAQRDSYGQYLGDPSTQELARYFHLDDSDHTQIVEKRGDANRLGFALQLTTVRFVGTFLDDPTAVPPAVLATMSRQLGIELIQLNRGEGRHALARAVFHGKRGELRQRYREGQENQLDALGVVVNMIVAQMATRCVQKTRRDCHRSATSTSTCWDATRSPYLNRSLGASSGRSETPLTAVANRTFRSIAPQTPGATREPEEASAVGVRNPSGFESKAPLEHLPLRHRTVRRPQEQHAVAVRPMPPNAIPQNFGERLFIGHSQRSLQDRVRPLWRTRTATNDPSPIDRDQPALLHRDCIAEALGKPLRVDRLPSDTGLRSGLIGIVPS